MKTGVIQFFHAIFLNSFMKSSYEDASISAFETLSFARAIDIFCMNQAIFLCVIYGNTQKISIDTFCVKIKVWKN